MLAVPLGENSNTHAALTDLVATLHDTQQIGLGRAAEIAGLACVDRLDEMGRRGIATFRLTPEALQPELAAFGP